MKTLEVADHITEWIKDYADKSHCKGFVIGVSGGIDSATSSTLAARTGLPLICVEMPIHQAANQVSRAMNHIAWLKENFLNVSSVEVELTDIFDAFVSALPPVTGSKDLHDHSLVNTRARFRMTTLYYFAALHGYLVVGTGNKVEDFGIGFYTKYGDGGVDLSPIADLMKTEVYAIAKTLGVNQDILDAPPTDGLWGDDRTDADQIGASYPELEWAMEYSGEESVLDERQKKVLSIYRRLNRANQHKMEPIPVCAIPENLR